MALGQKLDLQLLLWLWQGCEAVLLSCTVGRLPSAAAAAAEADLLRQLLPLEAETSTGQDLHGETPMGSEIRMDKVLRAGRWAIGLLLVLGLMGLPLARAAVAPTTPIRVGVDLDNVYGFSAHEKSYTIEGTLRLALPAARAREWIASGIDPTQAVRFQNRIKPWDSRVEVVGKPVASGDDLTWSVRFNSIFYSDDLDFRGYPLSGMPLELLLTTDPELQQSQPALGEIRLVADRASSGLSRRSNMNGYTLTHWTISNVERGVRLRLFYRPIGTTTLVKWLLPLLITMLVLLLTASLSSALDASLISQRLAVPPVILLTVVFMQQSYRDTLPPLPYLTSLDSLYTLSYLVTLAFFCEFIWAANRMAHARPSTAERLRRRVDRLELGLQLLSIAAFTVMLLCVKR